VKQLNLFTLKELLECYEATEAVKAVRASLRKSATILNFPFKKVS